MTNTSFRRPSAGAFLLFTMSALGLSASPAAAAVPDAGKYRVSTTPMVILPPAEGRAAGEERMVSPGDILLQAPLGWFDTAMIDQPLKLNISGIDGEVPAGILLMGAKATGGDLGDLAQGAKVYCGPEKANLAKGLAAAMTLGLSSLANRVAKLTRFCLVDSDMDGRFDKSFLVGLKKPEDRHMVDIEPVGYAAAENRPMGEDSYIRVKYKDGGMFVNANFEINVFLAGAKQGIQGIYTGGPAGEMLVRTKWFRQIKSEKIPQAMAVGPAQFTVTSFDTATKGATIRYDRDFTWTPLVLEYTPQVIYVYVPG